jgi:C1A family cysteine protease
MNEDNDFARDRTKTSETRRTFLRAAGAVTALSAISSVKALAQGYNPALATPPQSFDLRSYNNKNYVTEVRDQGGCNSCTAYAVVAAMETAKSIKDDTPNPLIHLSEDQLFSCAGPGCDTNAWYPNGALDYCKTTGLTGFDAYFPVDGICHQDTISTPLKISDWRQLNTSDEMKQWISGNNPSGKPSPVISVFVLYQDLFDHKPNNPNQVYRHNDNSRRNETRIGGHVVCIIGYKDNPGYWICKNSWGSRWGGAGMGFFNIAYGDCHVDDYRMYGIVL